MRTESLAILLTDIQGFTARTSQQTREENERWLARHAALVLPIARAFGGTERSRVGDAFQLTFTSPTNAVLCATAVQDRLAEYNTVAPENERLRVRTVLSLGEVGVRKVEVTGEAVTVAQRLEATAEPGEVLLTEALYLAMTRAEVPTEEVGLRRLPGLGQPVKVYRVPAGDGTHPYGRRALAAVSDLPPLTTGYLEALRSDPESLASRAMAAATASGSALARDAQRRLKRLGLSVGAALVVVILVGALLVRALWPADARTRLMDRIESGELEAAAVDIATFSREHPERPGEVFFLEGYLAWHRGNAATAARLYRRSIEASPEGAVESSLILDQMVGLLESSDCSERTQAARTLGALGDRAALRPLEKAIEVEPSRRGGALGKLLCRFAPAARRSVEQLGGG